MYLRIGMTVLTLPSQEVRHFSPSRSLTYAFFQSERRPTKRPWRFTLPCAIDVRTLATFEPSSVSTACLMSILLASARHLEHQRPAVLADDRRLLGDERPADDVGEFHD